MKTKFLCAILFVGVLPVFSLGAPEMNPEESELQRRIEKEALVFLAFNLQLLHRTFKSRDFR